MPMMEFIYCLKWVNKNIWKMSMEINFRAVEWFQILYFPKKCLSACKSRRRSSCFKEWQVEDIVILFVALFVDSFHIKCSQFTIGLISLLNAGPTEQ